MSFAMDQDYPLLNSNEDVDNELLMDVCELSVSLGNLTHDVCRSTKILEQHSAPLGGYSESVLLANFRQRFEKLKQGADAEEIVLLEARGNRFMLMYKELKDLEPDKGKRTQHLMLLYVLFDTDSKKLENLENLKVIKNLRFEMGNLQSHAQPDEESSDFSIDNVCFRKFRREADSPRFNCINGSTGSIINNIREQIGDYKRMEGFIYGTTIAQINSFRNKEKSDLQNSKDDDNIQETILNIPENDINCHFDNTRNFSISSSDILNYKLGKKKSFGKYVLKNDAFEDLSHKSPNSSINSNSSFLDEEYDIERLSSANNSRKNIYILMENAQYLENSTTKLDLANRPGEQFQTSESELLLKELTPVAKNESHLMPEPWDAIRQTVSDIKTNILKTIDHSLLVLDFEGQPKAEDNEVKVPIKNHPDNDEHGKLISKVDRSIAKSQRISPEKVHWEHQQHIIIAPRVVIQLFKTNPAYKCAQAQNFYEQVNQLFEIIGQRNSTLPLEVRSIQSRLLQILQQMKRELPRNISYSEWVAAVGKYQLNQLLSAEEMHAYESLCQHLREDEVVSSQYPRTEESKFRDALRGMMGHESELLKASSLTGRLQIRSPHHQESVSESYLLLTLGLLGYLYRSLKDQLKKLEQRGKIGVYLVRDLRKKLHTFREFLNQKKNQPSSLLWLYWQSREYQLLLQWLLELLTKINLSQDQAIIVSLYEESCRRSGEQWRLLQMWLSEASKPLISKLVCWLSSGQLIVSEKDEFIIERSLASTTDDFWQKRYRLAASFSKLFNRQLTKMMIDVGKMVAYSKKYLYRKVKTPMSGATLIRKLISLLAHFYLHGDQEPLFHFLHKLHLDASGQVLRFLRNQNPSPKILFYQMHKYLMITDMHFYRELMQTLEGHLREPASAFNIKLFNIILCQILPRQTADIYVDRSTSQGSKCWSCFQLRLKLPDYWTAFLSENIQEYETIFSGLWKFHYANYVLCEMVARRESHYKKHSRGKHFDCIDQVDQLFDILFDLFLDAMNVLKNYLLTELLEPAYRKLRLDCEEANTLDDMLSANKTYLRTIKLGCFQTRDLMKCNIYMEQLYHIIMELDFHEHRFYMVLKNFRDYLTKYGGQTSGGNEFLIPSYELTEKKREFHWSCQTSIDALTNIKDQFHMTMFDLLFRLHSEDIESFRRLAQKLDRHGYYERMDQRLEMVQRFEFKRKGQRKTL